MTNQELRGLLLVVEAAVDARPELTRVRPSGFLEIASFSFDESGWSVRLRVKNKHARGRGARGFYDAFGSGETPAEAVAVLVERIPLFVEATS